jgi:hypothetical protein
MYRTSPASFGVADRNIPCLYLIIGAEGLEGA